MSAIPRIVVSFVIIMASITMASIIIRIVIIIVIIIIAATSRPAIPRKLMARTLLVPRLLDPVRNRIRAQSTSDGAEDCRHSLRHVALVAAAVTALVVTPAAMSSLLLVMVVVVVECHARGFVGRIAAGHGTNHACADARCRVGKVLLYGAADTAERAFVAAAAGAA